LKDAAHSAFFNTLRINATRIGSTAAMPARQLALLPRPLTLSDNALQ